MKRFASLTSRLVVTAVALVAVVSLLIGTTTALAMNSYLTSKLDSQILNSLATFDGGPGPGGSLGAPPGAGLRFQGRNQPPGTLIAFLGDKTQVGSVLTEDRNNSRQVSSTGLDLLGKVPLDGAVHEVHLPGFGAYRVTAVRADGLSVNTNVPEPGILVTGLPSSDVDDTLASLIWWEVLLTLLGVVVAAGVGLVVVRRQLRPLREVADTAHAVSELDLSAGEIELGERVPERLTDERTEVGQVGAALNTLLAHVETSLEARHRSELQVRQFVADASHELRTPLATIAGYTELARGRPDDVDAVSLALGKVDEESARMTSLVEDLLLLARLDAGRPLEREPVDLTRMLVEAVSDARVLAPDHHWRLELPEDPDDAVDVPGDEQRLHQVVTNLLTNARKHTPAGTTVTVAIQADGFSVHDDGPGFPADLRDTAFERFARGDASRNREGGAGLGLSLVDAIVTAHGGTVLLASAPGDTTIRVALPR
ncbi:HAMP domain-containing sensor histidine kinase [Nocardioides sp.]|uniref:sensor histidine kinase n=1 Tax=Nocardioides sp. TaxID=35761 RepID=UPI0031FE49B5|nr:ATP-binding region, ATPase domain protein [Nocardioides sp.]